MTTVSKTRRTAGTRGTTRTDLEWLMWTGLVVEVEMSCGADCVLVSWDRGRW